MKERDQLADIDFVKVDYAAYLQKTKINVTTEDLANYIKQHPVMFKAEPSRNLGIVFFPSKPSAADDAAALKEITKLYSEVQMPVEVLKTSRILRMTLCL